MLIRKAKKWPFPFYKTTGEEFLKSIKLYQNSVFRVSFSKNPPPPQARMKNSVVPSKNYQNSVFRDKSFPNAGVPQTLMTPTTRLDEIELDSIPNLKCHKFSSLMSLLATFLSHISCRQLQNAANCVPWECFFWEVFGHLPLCISCQLSSYAGV